MSTPHIIISYRRADSDAIAGRIRDRLAGHFGESSVFMDIDNIPFGTDFRQYIQAELSRDHILVAIIGPKWLGPRKGGHFRIAEETDPVRIELETALKKGSPVIPVLVNGATMPSPSELPESLKDLSYRNAAEVDTGRDFHQHIERLIRSMDHLLAVTSRGEAAASNAAVGSTVAAAAPAPARIQAAALMQAPDNESAAVAKGPAVTTTALQDIPPAKARPFRARRLVALCAFLVAGLGAGAWLYVRSKDQVVPPPAAPSTAEPGSSARPIGVASAGCKLDIPVAFADDFQTLDPAWLLPAQIAYQVDGQLALKALEGKSTRVLYPPLRFKNVVICASVKSPIQPGSLDGASGGVIFWASDIFNLYVAVVYLNGTYSIDRFANNKWVQVIRRTPFESIKSGAGAVNEILVATKDNTGTLYINGVEVQQFRGQPPKDGGVIGLYGESNSNERNEWRVLNVAVGDPDQTQLQANASAPAPAVGLGCKPLRRAAFDDNFKTADPGWDVVSGNTNVRFADGEMVIKPDAKKLWKQLYRSLFFKNATVCIHIKSPSQMTDINGSASGGLVFWAADLKNYYAAAIYPDGRFAIDRLFDSQWARVVRPTKTDAVKTGLGVTNELMVTFNGNMAAFYVNNKKMFEFRGQPPQNGGSIGLYADSEATAQDEWRFTDIVVVEHE